MDPRALTNAFFAYISILYFYEESFALKRHYIQNARAINAICNDNSEAIYYKERYAKVNKWIIYLESGGACSDFQACNWRYKNFPHLMSSKKYPDAIDGLDLMSSSLNKNPFFSSFNKIIIPYCSSDLWLGNLTKNGSFSFQGDDMTNYFSFQGKTIFYSVINELTQDGLSNATEVLLAGSSAGGIGVVNHLEWFKKRLPDVTIKVLIDSSWLVNFDEGLTNMMNPAFSNVTKMNEVPACKDQFFGYSCCASIECMLIRDHFKLENPILFLFSFYDSFLLKFDSEIVGTADSLRTFDLLRKLSGLRSQLEKSFDALKNKKYVSYIVPACFQHHFIATSSLWKKGNLLHKTFEKEEKMVRYKHVIEPGIWLATELNNQNLQTLILSWYKENATTRLLDSCHGAQCNPTCTSGITYEAAPSSLHVVLQITLLAVSASFVLLCVTIKLFFVSKFFDLVKKQKKFVREVSNSDSTQLCCDLPAEAPKDAIGISCFNLTYEVSKSRKVHKESNIAKRAEIELKSNNPAKTLKGKRILKGITAYFNPGQLVGVMGPSGCGKTTFLDLLAGRRHTGLQQGSIYINGVPVCYMREWAKMRTGYVLQLTCPYFEQLTVRENLTFSAILRLQSNDSYNNVFEKIDEVLTQTGLQHRAGVRVGGLSGGKLSGGEKRRLCVANQLLDSPSLLLMDEPTSGLDAASSLELLQLLHRLAVGGKLVILTIHQPRSEIFHMFDTVLFLCQGQVAYFGSPLMSPKFVLEAIRNSTLENRRLSKGNPADTILDFLNKTGLQQTILDHYRSCGEIQAIRNAIIIATKESKLTGSVEWDRKQASFGSRMFAWECRATQSQTVWQKLFLPLVFIVCGSALSSVYFKTESGVTLLASIIVFTCFSQLFMASVIHGLMNNCQHIFYMESQDGIGSPLEIILQLFVRAVSVSTFPVMACTGIVYYAVVNNFKVEDMLLVMLIAVLLNQAWSAVLILVNVCTLKYSPMLTQFIAAVAGFSGGFLVPKPEMPRYYFWIFFVNPTQWAFSSIAKIILLHTEFKCHYKAPLECQQQKGIIILDQFDVLDADPYESIFVLLLMTSIALILSILIMTMKVLRGDKTITAKQVLRKITGRTAKGNFQKLLLREKDAKESMILQNFNSPEHMLQTMRNGSAPHVTHQRDGGFDNHAADEVFFTERELEAKYMDFEINRHAVFVTNGVTNRGRIRQEGDSDSCSSRFRRISKVSPGRISINDASSEILKERCISFQNHAEDVVQSFGKVVEDAMLIRRTGRKWMAKIGKRRLSHPHESDTCSSQQAAVQVNQPVSSISRKNLSFRDDQRISYSSSQRGSYTSNPRSSYSGSQQGSFAVSQQGSLKTGNHDPLHSVILEMQDEESQSSDNNSLN